MHSLHRQSVEVIAVCIIIVMATNTIVFMVVLFGRVSTVVSSLRVLYEWDGISFGVMAGAC